MKLALLTTPTKHHTYFIQNLARRHEVAAIVYERRRLKKDYPTGPFLEEKESEFEERFFLPAAGGVERELPEELQRRVVEVHSVNQQGMPEYLRALGADVGVTFGTGIVKPAVFGAPRLGSINVHRGISGLYRGLDSDLWAVLDGRFDQIGVTIHWIDDALDTGNILSQETVPLAPEDELHHLRYKTTVAATRMVLEALERIEAAGGRVPGTPQDPASPYYSAMPLEKKLEALRRFEARRRSLARG